MAIINNKEVIQSYVLTTAKYNYSVYEKRIIYRLIDMVQYQLEGKKLNKGFSITEILEDDRLVEVPLSAFLKDDDDENYTRVKKALRDLRNKTFEYECGSLWKLVGIIEKPKFDKKGWVKFELQKEVYEAILDFSKGFRKYELKTAMLFESQYSMRFYELMSGQKKEIIYTIDHMKIMFSLQNKYKENKDFIKKVIDAAKKELDQFSPYSFEYEKLYQGKKIHAIKFKPIFIAKNRDEDIEKHELQKQTSLRWDLDKMVINYLKQNLLFSEQEIKNNIDLLKKAHKKLDLMLELSLLNTKAQGKKNEKGYIINALKGKLTDL